jgi:hypothetical protein
MQAVADEIMPQLQEGQTPKPRSTRAGFAERTQAAEGSGDGRGAPPRRRVGRLPHPVEASAYFVVAEALTNVAKHSRAGRAEVTARIEEGTLQVQVRDNGVGGARRGSGLLGLADRLAMLDGRLDVDSPADGGTLVAAAIPLTG